MKLHHYFETAFFYEILSLKLLILSSCVYCYSFQKSEWKLHRIECQALSRLSKERRKSLTPSLRLMVRLYLKRKLQNERVNNLNLLLHFQCFDFDDAALPSFSYLPYGDSQIVVELFLQRYDSLIQFMESFAIISCHHHTVVSSIFFSPLLVQLSTVLNLFWESISYLD